MGRALGRSLGLAWCLLFVLASCKKPVPEAVYPVERAYWLTSKELVLRISPEVSLDDVLDLTLFGDFQPGTTFTIAREQFGDPEYVGRDSTPRRDEILRFDLPASSVEIVRQENKSSGYEITRWLLRAVPKDNQLDSSLDSVVASYVEYLGEEGTLVVRAQDQTADVEVAGTKIQFVWLRPAN